MLNSCAPGVTVVNIDNGFGAAAIASRINHSSKDPATPRAGKGRVLPRAPLWGSLAAAAWLAFGFPAWAYSPVQRPSHRCTPAR
jgi:hypothetical protein